MAIIQSGSRRFTAGATIPIVSGVITVTQSNHIITAETGTADDLATITIGAALASTSHSLIIRLQADTSDTITIKHGTGNIEFASGTDFSLASNQFIDLHYDVANTVFRDAQSSVTADTRGIVLIGEVVLGSAAASMTVGSIPATYRNLKLVLIARNDASTGSNVLWQFNSDTTATNYATQYDLIANAISTLAQRNGTSGGIFTPRSMTPNTALASSFAQTNMDIAEYANTGVKTNGIGLVGYQDDTPATAGAGATLQFSGFWNNTAAITTITVVNSAAQNFATGSTLQVYGVL